MGFIYKITNTQNGKVYIGQTIYPVEWRWKTHLTSAYNQRYGDHNVLFHRAIRKHGIDAFTVEIIEECDNSKLNEREIFWIAYYKSFGEKGYNISRGGGGYRKYDDADILREWNLGYSISDISRRIGCGRGTVRARLISAGITNEEFRVRADIAIKEGKQKRVYQYDKNGNYLKCFYSVTEAAKEVKRNKANIAAAANGQIKSVGGYLWSYEKKETLNPIADKKGFSLVGKYDKDGKLLVIYTSLSSAESNNKDIGVSRKTLSTVVVNGNLYKGYYWRYIKIEKGIVYI